MDNIKEHTMGSCYIRIFNIFLLPAEKEICALIPTPKPMATALIKFCTGKTRDRAVIACSLIFATKSCLRCCTVNSPA